MLKKKTRRAVSNRKRVGFVLTQQRALMPIALGAGTAAIVVHVFLYMFFPAWDFSGAKAHILDETAKEKIIQVVLKDAPEKEYKKAEEPPPDETDAAEIQKAIAQDVKEIDILDYKPEELTLAPGETDLAFPDPTPGTDAPGEVAEMPTEELDSSALAEVSVSPEALRVAEPTPVNVNDVIVMAEAQNKDVEDASDLMNAQLRESAKAGNGDLPSDTRTLDQLMGLSNLGSESGVARLKADFLFRFDECRLMKSARFSMLQLAALIEKNPETNFVIEGHTDNIGGDDYNALLSLQRAAAVCEWLTKNRVPTSHVYMRACANKAPLVTGKKTREEQALNRRVEIHMRRHGEPLPEGCFPASYAVDLVTPTRDQLAKGVRVPETYTASGTSVATDNPETAKPEPAKPAPARTEPPKPTPPKQTTKPGKTQKTNGKTGGKKK